MGLRVLPNGRKGRDTKKCVIAATCSLLLFSSVCKRVKRVQKCVIRAWVRAFGFVFCCWLLVVVIAVRRRWKSHRNKEGGVIRGGGKKFKQKKGSRFFLASPRSPHRMYYSPWCMWCAMVCVPYIPLGSTAISIFEAFQSRQRSRQRDTSLGLLWCPKVSFLFIFGSLLSVWGDCACIRLPFSFFLIFFTRCFLFFISLALFPFFFSPLLDRTARQTWELKLFMWIGTFASKKSAGEANIEAVLPSLFFFQF